KRRPKPPHQQIGARQRLKRRVALEERADLLLGGAAAEAGEPPHQLHVGEVAGRDAVVAALAVVGELVDRPAADLTDRAQALPAGLVLRQVGAPRRHLACHADHRDRSLAGQVAGLELGRRPVRQGGWGGGVEQGAAGAAAAVAKHQPPLDARRALGLDELLGDRPGQRLERLGPPQRPDPWAAPDHRAEQRVAFERAVEVPEVVVDPQREAHALDRVGGGLAGAAFGADPDAAGGGPGGNRDRLVTVVHQPDQGAVAAAHNAVAARDRHPVRTERPHVLLDGLGRRYLLSRWTSTRNERVAATSTPRCWRRLRPRTGTGVRLSRRISRTSTQVATPTTNPPAAAMTGAGRSARRERTSGAG